MDSAGRSSALITRVSLVVALVAGIVFPGISSGEDSDYSAWLPVTNLDWAAQANEDLGIRHAVRIFDGTQLDERPVIEGRPIRYASYERVRVFDEEGIDAFRTVEVTVPQGGRIVRLAARVAKPDGRMVEVDHREMREKKVVSRGGDVLKARTLAFPSVDPGDILEWRYAIERDWDGTPRVQLRHRYYTVRAELIWWFPVLEVVAGDALELRDLVFEPHYIVANPPPTGADVMALPERGTHDHLQITMHNLSALPDEPYLPAEGEIATYFVGWFGFPRKDAQAPFWDRIAKDWGHATDDFIGGERTFDRWMDGIRRAPRDFERDLSACLTLLHRSVRNVEDVPEAEVPEDRAESRHARDVLEAGLGTEYQLAALYTSMLRRLGYAATVFHAPSREDGPFLRQWENATQLTLCGTAVRDPAGEIRWVFPGYATSTARTVPWMAQAVTALLEKPRDEPPGTPFPRFGELPLARAEDNRIDLAARVRVLESGDLTGRLQARWQCDSDPGLRSQVVRHEGKEAADLLRGRLRGIGSTFVVSDESATADSTGVAYACSLQSTGMVQAAARRLLVDLGAFRVDGFSLPQGPREFPVQFRHPEILTSRVILAPPDGYALESCGADSFSSEFLKFRCSGEAAGAEIIRSRAVELLYSDFTSAGADTLRSLFRSIHDADAAPLILAPRPAPVGEEGR